jgi:hypothetical protein
MLDPEQFDNPSNGPHDTLLPATGGRAAVDMHDLAGDKLRSLQVHHGVGDFLCLAMRPIACRLARKPYASGACIGVTIAPGETAFTRTFLVAYSIAREGVIALSPPLVRAARSQPAKPSAARRSWPLY